LINEKADWFQRHRIITVVITLLIIWGTLLIFLWNKADVISKDPCSVCAEKMGSEVSCTVANQFLTHDSRVFYPNGSIIDKESKWNLRK
jgi:hypothetical protein